METILNSIKPHRLFSTNTENLNLISSTIICEICKEIPIKPLKKEANSNNYYCNDCLKKLSDYNTIKDKLIFSSYLEIKLLERLEIMCLNKDKGCEKLYKYTSIKDLVEHEKSCEFCLVSCPNNNCDFKDLLKNIKLHKDNCEFNMCNCQRCHQIMTVSSKKDHDCIKSLHIFINDLKASFNDKVVELENKYNSKIIQYENDLARITRELTSISNVPSDEKSLQNKSLDLNNKNYSELLKLIISLNDRVTLLENELADVKNVKQINNQKDSIKFGSLVSVNPIKVNFFPQEEKKNLYFSTNINNNLKKTIDNNNISSSDSIIKDYSDQSLKFIPTNCKGEYIHYFKHEIFRTLTKNVKEIKLIFKASDHNFLGKKFHEHCDGKPYNVTIIQSETGNIFGGYTPLAWSSINNTDLTDDTMSGFLFSITHSTKHQHFMYKDKALHCYSSFGPIFGGKEGCRDLVIYDECNRNKKSHSNLGYSYKTPDGLNFGTDEAKSYLAGKSKFKVIEYEVYQLIY